MEKDLCRSISKRISLGFARHQIQRAQQRLERIRLCDCSEIGGKRCQCSGRQLGENTRAMNRLYGRKVKEMITHTEETTGKSVNENQKIDKHEGNLMYSFLKSLSFRFHCPLVSLQTSKQIM